MGWHYNMPNNVLRKVVEAFKVGVFLHAWKRVRECCSVQETRVYAQTTVGIIHEGAVVLQNQKGTQKVPVCLEAGNRKQGLPVYKEQKPRLGRYGVKFTLWESHACPAKVTYAARARARSAKAKVQGKNKKKNVNHT